MAEELSKAGAKVTTGVGKLGVVGVIENGPGPVVLVRTDMDALPVIEQTGLPYASKVEGDETTQGSDVGVMHACGHDMHMTCLVGTARWLAEHKDAGPGPSSSSASRPRRRSAGPRTMLEDGLYTRFPKPDFALALHCDADSRRDGRLHVRARAGELDLGGR